MIAFLSYNVKYCPLQYSPFMLVFVVNKRHAFQYIFSYLCHFMESGKAELQYNDFHKDIFEMKRTKVLPVLIYMYYVSYTYFCPQGQTNFCN